MNFNTKPIGHAAAFFTITVWSLTFVAIELLLNDLNAYQILFYRAVLAVLTLNLLRPPKLSFPTSASAFFKRHWQAMAAGLFAVVLYFIFQNVALELTQPPNVSVLLSLIPLYTALLSRWWFKTTLKPFFFFGFAIAMAGIILIFYNGTVVLQISPRGDILSILAGITFALYSVVMKFGDRAKPDQAPANSPDTIAQTRDMYNFGLLFLLPFIPFWQLPESLPGLLKLSSVLNLLFLGVVASALCFILWNHAINLLGPVRTNVYVYMVPIITTLFSVMFLGDRITALSGVGMALILGGMGLSEREVAS